MSDDAPLFPSLEWMEAYAAIVNAHPAAPALRDALEGRFRFRIETDSTLDSEQRYDLVVTAGPDGSITAVEATSDLALLAISARYGRWRKLLEGRLDIVMAYLTRRIQIHGDVMALRSNLRDAKPLLDCLQQTPTRFL